MSNFYFYCVICGESLQAERKDAGGLIKCQCCSRVVPIPGYPVGLGESARCLGVFAPGIMEVTMKFPCPKCRNKLSIDVRCEGLISECPRCNGIITVPRWSPPLEQKAPVEPERPATPPALVVLSAAEIEFLSGVGDDLDDEPIKGHAV